MADLFDMVLAGKLLGSGSGGAKTIIDLDVDSYSTGDTTVANKAVANYTASVSTATGSTIGDQVTKVDGGIQLYDNGRITIPFPVNIPGINYELSITFAVSAISSLQYTRFLNLAGLDAECVYDRQNGNCLKFGIPHTSSTITMYSENAVNEGSHFVRLPSYDTTYLTANDVTIKIEGTSNEIIFYIDDVKIFGVDRSAFNTNSYVYHDYVNRINIGTFDSNFKSGTFVVKSVVAKIK